MSLPAYIRGMHRAGVPFSLENVQRGKLIVITEGNGGRSTDRIPSLTYYIVAVAFVNFHKRVLSRRMRLHVCVMDLTMVIFVQPVPATSLIGQ